MKRVEKGSDKALGCTLKKLGLKTCKVAALAFFVPENIIFNGGAREFCIAAAYVLSGLQAICMLCIMLKNLLRERKK